MMASEQCVSHLKSLKTCSSCQTRIRFAYPGKKGAIHDPKSGQLMCPECRASLPESLPGPLFTREDRAALPLCLLRQNRELDHKLELGRGNVEADAGQQKVTLLCGICTSEQQLGKKRRRSDSGFRGKGVIAYCDDCGMDLCTTHRQAHPADHTFLPANATFIPTAAPKNLAGRCITHLDKELEWVNMTSLHGRCRSCINRPNPGTYLPLNSAAPILRSRIASAFLLPLVWKRDKLRLTTVSVLPGLFGAVHGMNGVVSELSLFISRLRDIGETIRNTLGTDTSIETPILTNEEKSRQWKELKEEINNSIHQCILLHEPLVQSRYALVETLLEAMAMLDTAADGWENGEWEEEKNIAKLSSHLSTRPINSETVGDEIMILRTLEGIRELLEYGDPLLLGMNGDEVRAVLKGSEGLLRRFTEIDNLLHNHETVASGHDEVMGDKDGGEEEDREGNGENGNDPTSKLSRVDKLETIKEKVQGVCSEIVNIKKLTYWIIRLGNVKDKEKKRRGEEETTPEVVRIAIDLALHQPSPHEYPTTASFTLRQAANATGHPDGILADALNYRGFECRDVYKWLCEGEANGSTHPRLYCALGDRYRHGRDAPKDRGKALNYYNNAIAGGCSEAYIGLYKLLGNQRHKRSAVFIGDLYSQGMIDPVVLADLLGKAEGRCINYGTSRQAVRSLMTSLDVPSWLMFTHRPVDSLSRTAWNEAAMIYLQAEKEGVRDERLLIKASKLLFRARYRKPAWLRDEARVRRDDMPELLVDMLIKQRSPIGYLMLAEMKRYADTREGLAIMHEADQEDLAVPKIYQQLALAYAVGNAYVRANGAKAIEYAEKGHLISITTLDKARCAEVISSVYALGIYPVAKDKEKASQWGQESTEVSMWLDHELSDSDRDEDDEPDEDM